MILGGAILPFVGSMPTPELKLALVVVGGAIGSTIYVVIPMIVSELTPQPQRAGMLAITTSVVTLAGVLAPLAMGAMVRERRHADLGYERGYVDPRLPADRGRPHRPARSSGPKLDRKRLAAHAVALPPLQPARA